MPKLQTIDPLELNMHSLGVSFMGEHSEERTKLVSKGSITLPMIFPKTHLLGQISLPLCAQAKRS